MAEQFLSDYQRLSISTSEEGRRYRFGLTFPNGQVIYGVSQSELAIGGGNQFTSNGALLREIPVTGNVLEIKDKFNPVVKLGGRSAFSRGESTVVWEESNKPNFSLEFSLLASSDNEAMLNAEKIKLLQSAVLPIGDGGGLIAPLNYNKNGSGTLNLTYGTWFNARGLVVTNQSCTPTKQVTKSGYPLMWVVSITLEPYKVVTIQEFENYFTKVQVLDMAEAAEARKQNPNLFEQFVAKVNDAKKSILG